VGFHDGKTYLVTGVLTKRSIATSVMTTLCEQGAKVLVTSFDRARPTTLRTLCSLGIAAPVLNLDAASPTSAEALATEVAEHTGSLDGVLFAIAGAPKEALDRDLSRASHDQITETLNISAFALSRLTYALLPQLRAAQHGASIVALTFAPHRIWPGYGWMGVAKGALESMVKTMAVELGPSGIRVNQLDAGPLRTAAARQIPSLGEAAEYFGRTAPLGWNAEDSRPVAEACAMLLSPLLSATTGSTIVVDGGVHLLGGS